MVIPFTFCLHNNPVRLVELRDLGARSPNEFFGQVELLSLEKLGMKLLYMSRYASHSSRESPKAWLQVKGVNAKFSLEVKSKCQFSSQRLHQTYIEKAIALVENGIKFNLASAMKEAMTASYLTSAYCPQEPQLPEHQLHRQK